MLIKEIKGCVQEIVTNLCIYYPRKYEIESRYFLLTFLVVYIVTFRVPRQRVWFYLRSDYSSINFNIN